MARLKPRSERELRSIITRYSDLFPDDAAALKKLLDAGADATVVFERAHKFQENVRKKIQQQTRKPRERL